MRGRGGEGEKERQREGEGLLSGSVLEAVLRRAQCVCVCVVACVRE